MYHFLQNTNKIFLVAAGIFLLCGFIQLIYYILYSRILFYKKKKIAASHIPVSIIVCAKNEAENLQKFLPDILTQEYPEYEVVVVNDCSEDETEDILERMTKQYSHLKTTFIKKDEKFTHGKKLALSVGIKAAKNEWLLLTDADCQIGSKNWLSLMAGNFDDKTEIVLGFGGYLKQKGMLNKLIRFDTAFIALQYLSFALAGIPYMGVGRNLAYRKSLFFNNKGFASHAHIKSGDDDLFINEVAGRKNTKVEIDCESFTRSAPEESFFNWYLQKKRHLTTGAFYKPMHKFILALEPMTRVLFYFCFMGCLFYPPFLLFSIIVFGFRLIFQYLVYIFFTIHLKEKDLLLFLPVFDLMLPFINGIIAISNYFNKRAKYQWTK
ncbi:MAG: glycosyltransferase [Bacteroidia bacterium]|nr:glycosyltransferase [Bacteroidia bacterium]